ncbi:MAG: acyltransferase [Cytophagales bacterium]|nr:MAG: acyltransferase [Cytophagales bacterium]
MAEKAPLRSPALDFLRTLALVLVLFRHYGNVPFLMDIGWVGVDIFFVLSGYLVSGILLREWQKFVKLDMWRFWWRRSLKILPPFYALLLLTLILQPIFKSEFIALSNRAFLSELFFIQNYDARIWNHTWSLAVEEHFYVILLASYLLFRYWGSRVWLWIGCLSIAFCLGARVWSIYANEARFFVQGFQTHGRLDALFCGVLACLSESKLKTMFFERFKLASHYLSACLLVLFISLLYHFSNKSAWTLSLGLGLYACLNAYFLLYLKHTWPQRFISHRFEKACTFLSKRSYCIYLFHSAVLVFLMPWVESWFQNLLALNSFYWILSIVVGSLVYEVLEKPLLAWRDKRWPINH